MAACDENLPLTPTQIAVTPDEYVKSPNGISYKLVLKEASKTRRVPNICTPPPAQRDIDEKLKSAEERKKGMDFEMMEKLKQKDEKIKVVKRQILESIENHQKEVMEKHQKKQLTSEEILLNKKREFEKKCLLRESRAKEAKLIQEELLESKRRFAELQLSQLKRAEEKREAAMKAVIESAKEDLMKVEAVRAEQERKCKELEQKVQHDLKCAEVKRNAYISEIKEKCKQAASPKESLKVSK